MGVGSVATRLLADFGAEVIKIEDRTRVDMPRRLPLYKGEVRSYGEEVPDADPNRGGLFNNYSRNKLGVTINLRTERGRQLAEQLISASSVVTENFAPGVMERWGFTYERFCELVPDVIYARMSGYGHSGPHQHYRSYGPVVQAASGLSYVAGLPGREPSGWGLSYMDNMAAYYNSAALLMAIWNRKRTGRGTEIDTAAVEVGVGLLGPVFLDVTVNGRTTRRPDYPTGNRLEHPHAAPHGVYPCAGDDRWVAIAVFDQAEWLRLVDALGHPAWADDPAFADQESRFAHQDRLDAHLSEWTADQDPHVVMGRLQAAGVRAGAVQNPQDLNEVDPQLAHRGTFFEMDHPVIGPARFEGFPARLSGSGADHWRSAPLVGEDNDFVLGQILGLSEDERAALAEEGVI
jgi:crotonobetainyl-CoA:carnitine CoA-transferase CaiB-like acyl-CoA transferase